MLSIPYPAARLVVQPVTRPLALSLLLVAALVASIPLENSTALPSIGSISRLLGLVATGAVVMDAALASGFRRGHVAHLLLAAFVIWSAWTYTWSINPPLTSERIETNLQLLALAWVIWQTVRNLRDLRVVLQGFVLGSCCAAFLILINSQERRAYDGIRYSGAGADPNELGLTIAISMVMAFYLSRTAVTRRARVLWLMPFPLYFVGVILTVSRAAFIATTVALIGISIWHFRTSRRMRFAPIVAGVLLLAIGAAFVPKANIERIASIESEISTGRVGKRARIWKAGIELFQNRPLLGTGAATFAYAAEPLIGRDLAAHNTYVSVLTETGLIGFCCFGFALITFAMMAARFNTDERFLWLVSLFVWGIGVLSLTFEYKKATWVIFSLLIATAGISKTLQTGRVVTKMWDCRRTAAL